jgi:hypothetical protein
MSRIGLFGLAVVLGAACPAWSEIIDHLDIAGVSALPQSTMDAIGEQKWLFTHASVGDNMMTGMTSLHAADPTRYQLTRASVTYDSVNQRVSPPPTSTVPGTIYDSMRGNPGWAAKISIFDNSVRIAGWRDPQVEIIMDKFCYIDQYASAMNYLNAMATLEASYPNTVVVYTTMPLVISADSDNVLRNQFNAAVRAYALEHDRLLYDIADMEAYDPAGTLYAFQSGGNTYQKLYSGYTDDGGHLNATGQQRIALGWYATAAAVVSEIPNGSGAWRFDMSGNASVRGNWTGGVPNGPDHTATFGPVITGPRTVTLDQPMTLGHLVFDSDNPYTVGGANVLTLQTTGADGTIQVVRSGVGGHYISVPIRLENPLDIDTAAGAQLAVTGVLNNAGGKAITKTGPGVLTISGPQTHGPGALLNVLDGAVYLNSDAGTSAANLSVFVTDAELYFGSNQHLDTLSIGDGGEVVFAGAHVVMLQHLVMGGIDFGATTLTPEPATLALVSLGGLGILVRHQRRKAGPPPERAGKPWRRPAPRL